MRVSIGNFQYLFDMAMSEYLRTPVLGVECLSRLSLAARAERRGIPRPLPRVVRRVDAATPC